MKQRQTIGYEIVRGVPGVSFRIKGPGGMIVPGTDCPLWFETEAAAKGCAEAMIAQVVGDLRRLGYRVEKFTG